MPVTAEEVSISGKTAIDFHLKNAPIDQVKIQHPWSKRLMQTKKSYPGGKQYITEQLRYQYQHNFQFYNGRTQVTYTIRNSIEQAQYEYRGAHDGFSLDEDRLVRNGIAHALVMPQWAFTGKTRRAINSRTQYRRVGAQWWGECRGRGAIYNQ